MNGKVKITSSQKNTQQKCLMTEKKIVKSEEVGFFRLQLKQTQCNLSN